MAERKVGPKEARLMVLREERAKRQPKPKAKVLVLPKHRKRKPSHDRSV
jgi:hypothetical protein